MSAIQFSIRIMLSFALVTQGLLVPSLGWSQTGERPLPSSYDEARAEMELMDLIPSLERQEVPQNKRELVRQLLTDLSAGDDVDLDSLILDMPSDVTRALVKGLLTGEDSENLFQLLEVLEDNDRTFLTFLDEVRARVQSDPEKMERVRNNLELLFADIHATPARLPPFGVRWLQISMLSLAAMSMVYSGYDSFVYAHEIDHFFQYAKTELWLLGFFALATVNEVRVIKRTWRNYRLSIQRRFRSIRNLRMLRKVMRVVSEKPRVLALVEKFKYITSRNAEVAAAEALASYPAHFERTMEQLRENPSNMQNFKRFFRTRRFRDLMQKYDRLLTQDEKQQIRNLAQNNDWGDIPISVHIHKLEFEQELEKEFEAWMQAEGQRGFTDRFRRLLAKRRQMVEIGFDGTLPRNEYFLTTSATSIAFALWALSDVTERFNLWGYSPFYDAVARFFQAYDHFTLPVITSLWLVPYLFQIVQQSRHMRDDISIDLRSYMNPRKLDGLVEYFPRWMRRKRLERMNPRSRVAESACQQTLTNEVDE